jgi:Tfp pilus assembly protein PilF
VDGVLARKPKTPWCHYLKAKFALDAGKAAEARRQLERALLLDGKYPDAYLLLAQAELSSGRLKQAREAADRCVEIAPNLGRAYVVRAAVNQRAGRHDAVLADYRRALADFPYLFNERQREDLRALLAEAAPAARR